MRLFTCLLSFLLLPALPLSSLLRAQAPATPADPKQMLAETAVPIAVASQGAPPFRLKADFETFDYLGKPAGTGTVEELFLSPEKRKITVVLDGKSYPYLLSEGAEAMSTSSFFHYTVAALMRALVSPLPSAAEVDRSTLRLIKRPAGKLSLDCLALERKKQDGPPDLSTSLAFCTTTDSRILRVAQLPYGFTASYNRFGKFGTHYQAQDIQLRQGGVLRGKLTVTSFASAPDLKDADLPSLPTGQPPASDPATPAVPEQSVVAGRILTKTAPVYPETARAGHISGPVFLHTVIERDGTVGPIEVIGAPASDLAEAAIEAVHQWKYKPYLLNGAPVTVDTVITVNFSFGG